MKKIFLDTNQYECAKAHGCDLIITRNCKHFPISGIPVMPPSDYLREGLVSK